MIKLLRYGGSPAVSLSIDPKCSISTLMQYLENLNWDKISVLLIRPELYVRGSALTPRFQPYNPTICFFYKALQMWDDSVLRSSHYSNVALNCCTKVPALVCNTPKGSATSARYTIRQAVQACISHRQATQIVKVDSRLLVLYSINV